MISIDEDVEDWKKELDSLGERWKELQNEWKKIESGVVEEGKVEEGKEEGKVEEGKEEEKLRDFLREKKSKKEQYAELLKNLKKSTPGIKGVALITKNGLLIHSHMSQDVEIQTFSGMTAAMFEAAYSAIVELKKGPLKDIYVNTDDCTIVAMDVGPRAIMVALTKANCNIGVILTRMKRASKRAIKLIGT